MSTVKDWLSAFRLRTLPLAFSCIIMGSAVAYQKGFFKWNVFVLSILTALFLQILSNLANDYGDAKKGTDNENRIGPLRAIQSGSITLIQMKKAIVIAVILSFVSGLFLILNAFNYQAFWNIVLFVLLGVLAILAALNYTVGKKAYGYNGLGDLSVFLFFGLIGVLGSFFLHAMNIDLSVLLPATSIGLLSVAVLNLNNLRDYSNDKACGKNTLVVKIGVERAKKYHVIILISAVLCTAFYTFLNSGKIIDFIFLIAFAPLFPHIKKVIKIEQANLLMVDAELKKVAISTFLFSILFWISILI